MIKNYSQMEYTKTDLNWLMKKTEDCSNRYMEAEKFILEIAEMKWYQRVFFKGKILRFLNSRSKYNF
ncbi:MAG: hypothetical protein JETCAE03_35450 [Ignavibacteriaceae bacterium]|nr:MAG: hypothetical protein JETCAE03_35450 [Ignavibacteriaceae bacterium]